MIYQGAIERLVLDDVLGRKRRDYAELEQFPVGVWTVKLYDSQYEEAMTRIKNCQQIKIIRESRFYGGANVALRFRNRPRITFEAVQE